MKNKIEKISASWFRGFSEVQELRLGDKSIAVYGENGSGKSSFVDIVEYLIKGGKVEHLRHEYSGKRQEKGIINTHRPKAQQTTLCVGFKDSSVITADIALNGSSTITPEPNELSVLESQKVILRQDEVADFIKSQKGEKYSSLLPLLGLGNLDIAIENLRRIEKEITDKTQLNFKKGQIQKTRDDARARFGGGQAGKQALDDELKALHGKYCSSKQPTDNKKTITEIEDSLSKKLDELTKEQARYGDLLSLSRIDIEKLITEVRSAAAKLAKSSEPLIAEKLEVLDKASTYTAKIESGEVQCPACGTTVAAEEFKKHVEDEYSRLKDAYEDFRAYKKSVDELCTELQQLKILIGKASVKGWKDAQEKLRIGFVEGLDTAKLRSECTEKSIKELEENVVPLVQSAKVEIKNAPPEIKELLADRDTVSLIKQFVEAGETHTYTQQIDSLLSFLQELQTILREKIKIQSSAAIGAISDDIARMWDLLHPDESIEGVSLYLPTDQDKAIEVSLQFYGVEQMSPRLTLSEGHRNSLGLCIFLAMAKNVGDTNIPIILDDVVVSFDRNHRGRVTELLEKELSDRQILLFTHDREWFIELKQLLDASRWDFKALMPWRDPTTGIRWSAKETTFDDAREQIDSNPSGAGNEARRIMDTWLPGIAEGMRLKMSYLFREKNDSRMAHEFLERMISDGKKAFMIDKGSGHEVHKDALDILDEAKKQLAARANRASHSHSFTKTEAIDLINKCEAAIGVFTCDNCNTLVTRANDSKTECIQCRCGKLIWKYGKV